VIEVVVKVENDNGTIISRLKYCVSIMQTVKARKITEPVPVFRTAAPGSSSATGKVLIAYTTCALILEQAIIVISNGNCVVLVIAHHLSYLLP